MDKQTLEQLRQDIRTMKPNSHLHNLLRQELTKLNLWLTDNAVLEYLKTHVPKMKRWQPLYKTLKNLLSARNYWQNHGRGNPKKGYKTGMGKFRGEK